MGEDELVVLGEQEADEATSSGVERGGSFEEKLKFMYEFVARRFRNPFIIFCLDFVYLCQSFLRVSINPAC